MTWETIIGLCLSGGISIPVIITYFVNRGRDAQRNEQRDKEIKELSSHVGDNERDISELKQSTAVELAIIKTQIVQVQANLLEIGKDVKTILKNEIIKG